MRAQSEFESGHLPYGNLQGTLVRLLQNVVAKKEIQIDGLLPLLDEVLTHAHLVEFPSRMLLQNRVPMNSLSCRMAD